MSSTIGPALIDWTGYKGGRWIQPCVHTLNGATVNITGREIVCTIKARKTDPEALRSIVATLTTPSSGGYELDIDTADSDDWDVLDVGDYWVDLWFRDAPADIIGMGTLHILQPVRDENDN